MKNLISNLILLFIVITASAQKITRTSFNHQNSKSSKAVNMTPSQKADWYEGKYTPPAQYAGATTEQVNQARNASLHFDSLHFNKVNILEKGWLLKDASGKPKTIRKKDIPTLYRQGESKGWMVMEPVEGEVEWRSIERKDGVPTGNFPIIEREPRSGEQRYITVAKSGNRYEGTSAMCGNFAEDMVFLSSPESDDEESTDEEEEEKVRKKITANKDGSIDIDIDIDIDNKNTNTNTGPSGTTTTTTTKKRSTKSFIDEEAEFFADADGGCDQGCRSACTCTQTIACKTCPPAKSAWNKQDVAYVEEQLATNTAQNDIMIAQNNHMIKQNRRGNAGIWTGVAIQGAHLLYEIFGPKGGTVTIIDGSGTTSDGVADMGDAW